VSRLACKAAAVVLALVVLVPAGCEKSDRARNNDDNGGSNTSRGQPGPEPKPKVATPAEFTSLYGETGGEKTLAADEAPPSAPLRARKADSFYNLSKPRIEPRKQTIPPPPPGAGPLLVIDYERTQERAIDGNISVVVRTAGGKDYVVPLNSLQNRGGQISLEVANRGPWTGGKLPKDAEIYLTRSEGRYGKDFQKTFKVSNSVVMGESTFPVTQARDWSADEAAKLATKPVEAPKPNANPNVGQDTAVAGSPNAFRQRFAEAGQPLLGVDWYDWFWPVAGGREDCLGPLVPIYDRAYPDMGRKRALAKPGYAVGAITAKTKTYVSGIQITFMKLTADGKLDPADSYTTDWLGPHQVGTKETKLGGDGRRVLGLICDQAGHLSAIGLVMEAK
jgi:hypothetical protein